MRWAVALVAAAAGCVEIPEPAVPACEPGDDLDGDGWACDGIVPDCDDIRNWVNPGAADLPDDDIDGDCLGGDLAEEDELAGAEVAETGGFAIVHTRDLEIRFPDAGAGLPSSIREYATDLELVAPGGLGVIAAPGFDSSVDGSSVRTIVAHGPAVVEIEVAWTWPSTATGVSRFHILPLDRILRVDHVELDAPIAAGPYDFGVVAAFSPDRYNRVDWWQNEQFEPLMFDVAGTEPYLGAEGEEGWACFVHGAAIREIGFAWLARGPAGARVAIEGTADDRRLVLAYDWARGAAMLGDRSYDAVTMLTAGTAQFGSCSDTTAMATDLQDPEPFAATVDGGAVLGFDPERAAYRAVSDGRFVELRVQTAPAQTGVLIEAELGVEPAAGVTVWHDRVRMERGVDYHVQPGPGAAVTVWLATPLEDGDLIRIAAPGGEEPGG